MDAKSSWNQNLALFLKDVVKKNLKKNATLKILSLVHSGLDVLRQVKLSQKKRTELVNKTLFYMLIKCTSRS